MANKQLALTFAAAVAIAMAASPAAAAAATTMLTMHNLCPYPVWPLVAPDRPAFPSISNNTFKLDAHGVGLVFLTIPAARWSGSVIPRTDCHSPRPTSPPDCRTGTTPPATVVRLSVNNGDEGNQRLAEYSVSLADGFNVATVVSPHAIGGGMCPALGCAADLNAGCAFDQSVYGAGRRVVACRGPPAYFRERCPLTRTAGGGVEPLPQHCLAPGELKLVFCQESMVGGAGEPTIIRTVVADN